MAAQPDLTPESITARIISELRDHPETRNLLLRALLTDEFLEIPARLVRVEDNISRLKTDMVQVQADINELKADVAELKGTNLEIKSVQRVQSIITQRLGLRRPVTEHSLSRPMSGEYLEALQDAEEQGKIRPHGDGEVLESDIIMRAQRISDRETVWIVVEVSNTIDQHDITRARDRADLLHAAFSQAAMGAVAGRSTRRQEEQMAESSGVTVVLL